MEEFRKELEKVKGANNDEELLVVIGEIYSQGYTEGRQSVDLDDS